MYNIVYFELYKQDLQSTLDYISNILFNSDAAVKLYTEIKKTCKQISKNPYMFSSYIGNVKLKANYRKAKVGSYYIFFEVDDILKVVKVKRFIYSKMDSQNILRIVYM